MLNTHITLKEDRHHFAEYSNWKVHKVQGKKKKDMLNKVHIVQADKDFFNNFSSAWMSLAYNFTCFVYLKMYFIQFHQYSPIIE